MEPGAIKEMLKHALLSGAWWGTFVFVTVAGGSTVTTVAELSVVPVNTYTDAVFLATYLGACASMAGMLLAVRRSDSTEIEGIRLLDRLLGLGYQPEGENGKRLIVSERFDLYVSARKGYLDYVCGLHTR